MDKIYCNDNNCNNYYYSNNKNNLKKLTRLKGAESVTKGNDKKRRGETGK